MPVILIIIGHPINRWPHKPLAHASFVGRFMNLFVMYIMRKIEKEEFMLIKISLIM